MVCRTSKGTESGVNFITANGWRCGKCATTKPTESNTTNLGAFITPLVSNWAGLKQIKMKIETEKYNEALEKYLSDGINWDAYNNEVIKTSYKSETARGDVEQLAADSFYEGCKFVMEMFGIEALK